VPTAFVTGGTGFVGLNLVRELRARGWNVVAIHRQTSDLTYLAPMGARLAVADAGDAASVLAAMPDDADAVFHVAGNTSFWKGDNAAQTLANVDGTRNVVEASLVRRAKRFVHTSSIAAYGMHDGVCVDETTPSNAATMWVNYCRTKWLGEEEVRRGVARGLDAVIVNPGNSLGPLDFGNWSRLFVLLKAKRLPGVPPGIMPWCHVRDVVAGHIAAFERGRTGENYLLTGPEARFTEVAALMAEMVGVKPPRALPRVMMRVVGRVGEWKSRITHKAPDITPEMALLFCATMIYSCARAERELGYSTCDVATMVKDTYDWMLAEGRI
jgi:dihydroflavonol-4-reductase